MYGEKQKKKRYLCVTKLLDLSNSRRPCLTTNSHCLWVCTLYSLHTLYCRPHHNPIWDLIHPLCRTMRLGQAAVSAKCYLFIPVAHQCIPDARGGMVRAHAEMDTPARGWAESWVGERVSLCFSQYLFFWITLFQHKDASLPTMFVCCCFTP